MTNTALLCLRCVLQDGRAGSNFTVAEMDDALPEMDVCERNSMLLIGDPPCTAPTFIHL